MNLKFFVAVLIFSTIAGVPISAIAQSAAGTLVSSQQFPDVIAAKVRPARAANTFDFDVTLSSPYDTPQRYADAFRVGDGSGRWFGERILFHDHADEQPFTRDLYGVKIPEGVKEVLVQGRDQKFGYGGKTMKITLPGR